MRVRNRILQLHRANRLGYGSVPLLGGEDQQWLMSVVPQVLNHMADADIFEFVWRDSGIRIDEDYLVHYPDVEEWEWDEAMTCPVPHRHIWIETAVANPEGTRDRIYIWDVMREESGFTATPLLFDEETNSLAHFGTIIAVDTVAIDDLGRRGTVKVYNALNDYAEDYEIDEFYEQANMLARFIRMLCHPKVIVEAQAADPGVNRERRRRGREAIARRQTIWISEDAFRFESSKTASGTHASPKEHYRRAHKRRYADGRETEVRDCVVNRGQGPVPPLPQHFSVD